MRLRPEQLQRHLTSQLLPVYLISGDEPLQKGEAADAVRAAARQAGHETREVLEADQHFRWHELSAAASSMSLFAEKRILDLRLPSGKPGTEGSKALVEYCDRPPEDTLLLITSGRLEAAQNKSKWVKAIEALGAVVPVWPINPAQLPRWIEQRMQAAGLSAERGVASLLAERVEGNMLAARQEIEKLQLLHTEGPIDMRTLTQAAGDSARYDVFGLGDAALAGDAARCIRILTGLRAEGTATPVVLWALHREIEPLAQMRASMQHGSSVDRAMGAARVRDNRRSLVGRALQRLSKAECDRLLDTCHQVDKAIKGIGKRDPWLALEDLTLDLCRGARRAA